MTRRFVLLAAVCLPALVPAAAAQAAEAPCALTPKVKCFGVESLAASLAATQAGIEPTQAGSHPDLTLDFTIAKDPESTANVFGLKDAYAATRNVRIELPPGLVGDPNVLGVPQQCTVQELVTYSKGGGCPNGSQIGRTEVLAYDLNQKFLEPLYMMAPPGGEVVARLGFIAGLYPTFIDLKVRSEHADDFGLVSEIVEAPAAARLVAAKTVLWGVPASPTHDNERCTPVEAFLACVTSPSRPPGSIPLAFLTNPTRCGVPLSLTVAASSWIEPQRFDAKSTAFPTITGCNRLPFVPALSANPTTHRTSSPTGLDLTIKVPAAEGANVLEPSQTRDIRIDFPVGLSVNPGSADGLGTCSAAQVRFEEAVSAECPNSSKLADAEFEVTGLSRRARGALYLREPEPGNLFRVWVVADDLGAHVKLPGQLHLDEGNGQISSIVLESPQVPLREAKISLKSGLRAPLATPATCGTYSTHYRLTPWSGGPDAEGGVPMSIEEGCGGGGFAPRLSGGSTDTAAGQHAPFLFKLTREDGEQSPESIEVVLPPGLAATFADVPRCEGANAQSGACPAASRIGKVIAANGLGPMPLWVPQPGKDPTAVYLGGPYKGAPFSAIAVVPAQAGPFDLGDVVVRSAIFVDPVKARGIVRSDPLPQIIQGIPIFYRTVQVELDRPSFTLNPTSCARKTIAARVTSTRGAVAEPTTGFRAANCASLPFRPKLSLRLFGGTHRGAHPRLEATLKERPGDANIGSVSVALPRAEFLDQGHIGTVCTRVQFAARECPSASVYGFAEAITPLLDRPLSGPVYLRSSNHQLPDLVMLLGGELEIELAGRVDSINGGIRTSFEGTPDAPVTSFKLKMQGGRKGLLVNSTDLCRKFHRATAKFTGQNGRAVTLRPRLRASCGKGHSRRR
jgi:hypothetical protein